MRPHWVASRRVLDIAASRGIPLDLWGIHHALHDPTHASWTDSADQVGEASQTPWNRRTCDAVFGGAEDAPLDAGRPNDRGRSSSPENALQACMRGPIERGGELLTTPRR